MILGKIDKAFGRPNEKAIVQYLIKNPGASRTQIKEALSTSMATITNTIEILINNNYVIETGLQKAVRGRSTMLLEINKNKIKSVGIGVTKHMVCIQLIDLSGFVYGSESYPMDFSSFDNNVNNIVNGLKKVLDSNSNHLDDILGIGLALPGFIEYNFKNLDKLYMEDWKTDKLVETLENTFGIGVAISSASTAALSGEVYFGSAKKSRNVLYLNVSSGGISFAHINDHIVDKKMDRRARAIGHTLINFTNEHCSCGQSGCVEMYLNKEALIENYKKHFAAESSLYDDHAVNLDEIGYTDILKLGQSGDIIAVQAISKCATIFGFLVFNLVVTLNPDLVVLGGNIIDESQLYYDMAVNTANGRLQSLLGCSCKFSLRKVTQSLLLETNITEVDAISASAATIVFGNIFA